MIPGTKVSQLAATHIGQAESPLGSNRGTFVEACQRATFLAGTGWPWCAAFVCYVAAQAGVRLSYASASANGLADHYVSQGCAVSINHAHGGDVADFNIGSGHTAIIEAVDLEHGVVHTIDGNWGDRVERVVHPISSIRRIWRIPGVAAQGPAPHKPKLPPWVVATSAHGHRKIVFRASTKKGLLRWLRHHTIERIAPNGVTITRAKRTRR